MNSTPSANRLHIGFFGRRNAGKSSVVNAVTDQDLAVVSARKGTTTDPVSKAMELLPLGPVVIIDTPGYDDDDETLGKQRVARARKILNKTDIAVLVIDARLGLDDIDRELINTFEEKRIPYLIAYNKSDLLSEVPPDTEIESYVSAKTGYGIYELKERIGRQAPKKIERKLIQDYLRPGDVVILVTPIDDSAPKGRIILPQQQVIRDILDAKAISVVAQETELKDIFNKLKEEPKMVITDSKVFGEVAKIVPEEIPLTSFSIVLARVKGFLETAAKGLADLKKLKDGDTILISEGCTHHRRHDDIGTVRIPVWLRQFTASDINIKTFSGTEYPEDLSPYGAVVHCGACMLTEREIQYRMKCAVEQGVPFTNYGLIIAYAEGILKRSLGLFPDLQKYVFD